MLKKGEDVTIVSNSFMTVEAIHAVECLNMQGVHCDLIDLRTIRPIDWETIEKSVLKTGKLLVLDIGTEFVSIAGEIISSITERCFDSLNVAPIRICLPDHATPAGFSLTKNYYPGAESIVKAVSKLMDVSLESDSLSDRQTWPHDVPGNWFQGPF